MVFDDPRLSLGELKSLIARGDLLIGNDAGPRHIAKAFNVPVVTIFGPTHPTWTATSFPDEWIARVDVDCGPCQQRDCPPGHHRCMTEVSVAAAYEASRQLCIRAPSDSAQPSPMSQSSLRSVSHIDAVEQNGLWIARGYESLLEAHGIDSLEALAAYGGGERLDKLGLAEWRERWRITLGSGDVGPTLYLKRYTSPPRRPGGKPGAQVVARSLAAVEWRWMHRLRRDGIACVEPVAFGEECRGRREVRSLILTAAVPGVSLETLAAHRTDAHPSATARFCLKPPLPGRERVGARVESA